MSDKQGHQDLQAKSEPSHNVDQVSPSQVELGRLLGKGGFSDGSESAIDIYRTTNSQQEDETTDFVPRTDALVWFTIFCAYIFAAIFFIWVILTFSKVLRVRGW
jgi:hypothetical protein